MRRLTAALVLLALLLTGCVWSRRSVEKVCTEAAEALYAGIGVALLVLMFALL